MSFQVFVCLKKRQLTGQTLGTISFIKGTAHYLWTLLSSMASAVRVLSPQINKDNNKLAIICCQTIVCEVYDCKPDFTTKAKLQRLACNSDDIVFNRGGASRWYTVKSLRGCRKVIDILIALILLSVSSL